MNKYSLPDYLRQTLEPFQSTLKATSFDEANKVHLCQDETTQDVYDFDRYVKAHCQHPRPASPDAIYMGGKKLYFIEFKNQALSDVKAENMRDKFQAGTEILRGLLQGFAPKDCEYWFCVVVKTEVKPRYFDSRPIQKASTQFGLNELNQKTGGFYHGIVVQSVDFYVREFGHQLQCKPDS